MGDHLESDDLAWVLRHVPKDVRSLLEERSNRLFLAGGAIRAILAREEVSDFDLLGSDKNDLGLCAEVFKGRRHGARLYSTDNALTVLSPPRKPVQFITRWTFSAAEDVIASFDFTICQAVIWHDGRNWQSQIGPRFFRDLAARRLIYTHPIRDEDAGGSILRAIKFVRRGYSLPVDQLAGVIARLCDGVRWSDRQDETWTKRILTGLLREVDPLTVIDGVDVADAAEVLSKKEEVD